MSILVRVGFALAALVLAAAPLQAAETDGSTAIAVEALTRLKGIDLDENPAVKAALMRVLESTRGTRQFVELARDFQIKDRDADLLAYALANPDDLASAEAVRVVLANGNRDLLVKALSGSGAEKLIAVLANVRDRQATALLTPFITSTEQDLALRKRVLQALVQSRDGATAVLDAAAEGKLASDLKLAASSELNNVRWRDLKSRAAEVLPLPQLRDAAPLPPISELMKRRGDRDRGAAVFARTETACSSCHQVNGQGIDFGPNLSEIGTKLGKDALYESILDPSAGVSFGYEAWQVELKNGDEFFGLIVSETADEIALKNQTGVITKIRKSDVAKREKQSHSIMPAGLQAAMNTQDLVDLIEFLASLKKAGN